MTYREQMIMKITENLAAFIYEEDLRIGDYICRVQTEMNGNCCPYGMERLKKDCLKCMDDFLNKEIQSITHD
ncbi:MAG: hypothetical protein ACI4GD_09050 [Lachnospiraceae bacterium]